MLEMFCVKDTSVYFQLIRYSCTLGVKIKIRIT